MITDVNVTNLIKNWYAAIYILCHAKMVSHIITAVRYSYHMCAVLNAKIDIDHNSGLQKSTIYLHKYLPTFPLS